LGGGGGIRGKNVLQGKAFLPQTEKGDSVLFSASEKGEFLNLFKSSPDGGRKRILFLIAGGMKKRKVDRCVKIAFRVLLKNKRKIVWLTLSTGGGKKKKERRILRKEASPLLLVARRERGVMFTLIRKKGCLTTSP